MYRIREKILSPLATKLSRSHFIDLMPLKAKKLGSIMLKMPLNEIMVQNYN